MVQDREATVLHNVPATIRHSFLPSSPFLSPSFADVQQVSHHPEQQLAGADGTVVVGRHLVPDEVLALFGRQLFAFAEGIDVDKVEDVLAPVVINLKLINLFQTKKIFTKGALMVFIPTESSLLHLNNEV